ncbi:outer membrane protein assembly factor BamD [Altibacter sp.]|uniref:outer membrane protein assembly factor BamD n=1 Tax=Altibacter sp. TaxID=2024823 RepID=UPI002590F270|nr:outer membrane protein assembly factor BamD [Altibacter sp.]MCW9037544.1 outer membrane protein assembly factor BamD [Altibacter sp.]
MKASLLILVMALFFVSCSEYQKVLRADEIAPKYAMADSLYQQGKYKKALQLMEQIVPAYRGKPQAEKLMFMYANTFYNLEDFYLAGYQFERFETSYPKSDSVETAAYLSARSYYELSPRYSLDQTDTDKALERLQEFVNKYPNSEKRTEVNSLVSELRQKKEKKEFEVAAQYLRVSDYKAAISAFDNFITDNPGSTYRKDAFFGRFEAAYKLAINSIPALVNERLVTAKSYYSSFIKYYSDSDLKADADEILNDINKRLESETATTSIN